MTTRAQHPETSDAIELKTSIAKQKRFSLSFQDSKAPPDVLENPL